MKKYFDIWFEDKIEFQFEMQVLFYPQKSKYDEMNVKPKSNVPPADSPLLTISTRDIKEVLPNNHNFLESYRENVLEDDFHYFFHLSIAGNPRYQQQI